MDWEKTVKENIRYGFVEFLLLKMLSEKDMYGHEMKKALFERTEGAFDLNEALYAPLYKMAKMGLISSHRELAGVKRTRLYYHLEDAGREYLAFGVEEINQVVNGVMNLLYSENETEDKDGQGVALSQVHSGK